MHTGSSARTVGTILPIGTDRLLLYPEGVAELMDEPKKYREIAASLQGKVESGELRPGEKLPSDAELADNYEVARSTVREAIRLLTSQGVLVKQPGKGAFVPERIDPFSTAITLATGFAGHEGAGYASEVESRQRRPAVTTPKVEIQAAPDDIAAALEIDKGTTVVLRHQDRFIDEVLWSMQTTYYPKEFAKGADRLLEVEDISEGVRKY